MQIGPVVCSKVAPAAPRAKKLAVVIVNFKTPALVIQCLASLLPDLDGLCASVIVVDNCSPDDSVTLIDDWVDEYGVRGRVQVLRADENRGFSAGNNLGILAVDAQYYLLLNSDTIVRPGAVRQLLQAADGHAEAGIVSPRLEWPDGTPQQSCFGDISPVAEFIDAARTGLVTAALKNWELPLPLNDSVLRPDWTSFACVLVRKETIGSVGLLDERFFMYFEDAEYCRRARNAGWTILHDPAARVVHLRGGSSSVKENARHGRRLPSYYYASRTRYLYLTYGWFGLTSANVLWSLGRCISKSREIFGRRRSLPESQWRDIWTNWLCLRRCRGH